MLQGFNSALTMLDRAGGGGGSGGDDSSSDFGSPGPRARAQARDGGCWRQARRHGRRDPVLIAGQAAVKSANARPVAGRSLADVLAYDGNSQATRLARIKTKKAAGAAGVYAEQSNPMRVLVTGAYGLIGAACLARLHRDGHEVTGEGRDIRPGRAPRALCEVDRGRLPQG